LSLFYAEHEHSKSEVRRKRKWSDL